MIEKKLRSRAGASLIAALFLFLFCAMTGTVILTAASVNAGRLARRNAIDVDYYKVTSAAKLFADQLKEQSVKLTLQRDFVYNPADGSTTETFSPDAWRVEPSDADPFSAFLAKAVEEIYGASATSPSSPTSPTSDTLKDYWSFSSQTPISMIVSGKSAVQTLEMTSTIAGDNAPVYVRMTLQGDDSCAVRAIFSSKNFTTVASASGDSFQIPSDAYFVQLIVRTTMTATDTLDPNPPDPDNEEITTRTVTIKWTDAQILEGK